MDAELATQETQQITANNPRLHRFTPENAAEMQKKAIHAKKQRELREKDYQAELEDFKRKALLELPASANQLLEQKATVEQLQQVNGMIRRCKDENALCKLIDARTKLYRTIFSVPSPTKSKSPRNRSNEAVEPTEL